MNLLEIEKAGFQSLPAEHQIEIDGIVLRFNSGYTKRANSANVLLPQKGDYASLVEQCEQYYRAKDLPCIFRLPSFAQNQQLDEYLSLNGYQYLDHSLVLYRSLEDTVFNNEIITSKQNPSEWAYSFSKIAHSDSNSLQQIERIARVNDHLLLAVLSDNNREIACGLSVINNHYCGIFNVYTESSVRNQGAGTKLLNGILHWAINNGANKAYIQVVADNLPAINLYKKLGYQLAYEYHYRIKSSFN